jgi:hypothetical protein
MEMTAPYKPQMNGVVERSFVTARNGIFFHDDISKA